MHSIKETKIIRSKRKSLALTITPDATLIVKAPNFTPQFFINSFIRKHEDWIQKQLEKLEKRPQVRPKNYEADDTFLFLGMNLGLQYHDLPEISIQKSTLLFPSALKFRAQKQLTAWYKKQAREIITKQVEYYAKLMNTSYTGLTFSDTKSQWGSCSYDNKLQFSWRLIMTPITVINYVVVHELAHTFEKNHSKNFWEIVGKYVPSYRRQKKWLKEHGNTLVV
ncbi:MAG TPA: SprT family zinc-dependent metalloprotease [Candidatus Woesebacteria bacterium]|nr:SprT family zinc-dependent metalloprotease [Candidatus Woesebacteria bacterium]